MKKKSPFLVLILLLTACGPSRADLPATQTAVAEASSATQTAPVQGSPPTPSPSISPIPSCASEAVAYLAQLEPHYREFSDTEEVAGQTARIALAPVVQSLQAIKRDIEDIPGTSCVEPARALLIKGIESTIDAYLDFMGQASDAMVNQKMSQGYLDIATAMQQLHALAEGRPTPQPGALPTPTPSPIPPTPTATPTPLPVGSTIRVDNWDMKVLSVEKATMLKSTFSDDVTYAAGEYWILTLEVTNRGRRTDSFIVVDLELRPPAGGAVYLEDFIGTLYVEAARGMELAAHEIHPGGVGYAVQVFDVPVGTTELILGSGGFTSHSEGTLVVRP